MPNTMVVCGDITISEEEEEAVANLTIGFLDIKLPLGSGCEGIVLD